MRPGRILEWDMTARLRVTKGHGSRGRKEERLRALAESAIRARRFAAGEFVGGVMCVQPAAEIVREMTEEAERPLRQWGA